MRPATPARCVSRAAVLKCFSRTLFPFTVGAVILLCSGCTALRISHTAPGSTVAASVPGIPFFPKRARCRQEVVWFEPIYNLALAALVPQKDGSLQAHPRGTVLLSRTGFQSEEVTALLKLLNERPTDEGTVQRAWGKVVALADPHVLSRDFASLTPADRLLVGRSVAPAVYVDYADQYYVNAKVPLAGSANVDAKVASDGSLSEVSGQAENKTLETILSALPTSSVITGELGLGAGKSIAGAGEIEVFQVTISVSGYLHTLARQVGFPTNSAPCPVANDIALADATEYKREDIAATAGTAPPKKDVDNSGKPSAPKDQNAKDSTEHQQKP